jgi:hypothetical protein
MLSSTSPACPTGDVLLGGGTNLYDAAGGPGTPPYFLVGLDANYPTSATGPWSSRSEVADGTRIDDPYEWDSVSYAICGVPG